MLIKIDYREKDLYTECVQTVTFNKYKTPIKIVTQSLPLGDIIICDDDGKEHIIIERKCLNDLAASIQDGRYKEQSFRLHNCSIHNHNIYYLIEGDLRYYKNSRVDKRSIISSFVSISHLKGFSLHRTTDMRESAEWIIQIAEKIGKDKSIPAFYSNMQQQKQQQHKVNNAAATENDNTSNEKIEEKEESQNQPNGQENQPNGQENQPNGQENQPNGQEQQTNMQCYSHVIKRVKKENITPENIGEIMLSQIPNVSVSAAISIMKKFGTLQSLFSSLEKDRNCLNDVKTDKDRKINKTAISSIIKYVHYNIDR
jgi:ERCC4-type nuclease